MTITAKEFIKIWQTAISKDEIRIKTGLSDAAINTRASRYRNMGIPLRKFKPGTGESINLNSLIELARSLEPIESDNG